LNGFQSVNVFEVKFHPDESGFANKSGSVEVKLNGCTDQHHFAGCNCNDVSI
jgi:hypothetical protein